jgi:hypothetical protein
VGESKGVLMSKQKAVRRNSRRRKPINQGPPITMADHFTAALGWLPSRQRFHTTANRECGSCHAIKPRSEFDVPIKPGRPDLNSCRECFPTTR